MGDIKIIDLATNQDDRVSAGDDVQSAYSDESLDDNLSDSHRGEPT